jgi:thioredoxin-related protein
MKGILPLTVFLLIAALESPAAPSTQEVLTQAEAKAAKENKTIFVHFGASWCGWCKRLDAFLDRPDIKPVFEKYFVPVKLVVQEQDKSLENSGGEKLLKQLGGPDGLPYSAFLDAKGKLIINSKASGGNIGYPGAAPEIDWFVQMMKKAAPGMAEADLKVIESALRSFKKA